MTTDTKGINRTKAQLIRSRSHNDQRFGIFLEISTTFVELIRAVIWPLLIVILFFTFQNPIEEIMKELPKKLSDANKFSIGSLSFEIQQQAQSSGNIELAMRLGNLSAGAIAHLIKMGNSHHILVGESLIEDGIQTYFLPDNNRLELIFELNDNDLIEFGEDLDDFDSWIRSDLFELTISDIFDASQTFRPTKPLSLSEQKRLKEQHYRLNKLGLQAWNTVLDVVIEQLQSP
jgi:hypothetical protein